MLFRSEYCLKYDDRDTLNDFLSIQTYDPLAQAYWSPFEWSNKPKSYDLLSFAGYFGAVNSFKLLLLNGFSVNAHVFNSVVCGGSLDLFHSCFQSQFLNYNLISIVSEFCHLSLLEYLFDHQIWINHRDLYVIFFLLE